MTLLAHSSIAGFSHAGARPGAVSALSATVRDYAQLFKLRITAMIILAAWCGAYLASRYALQPLSSKVAVALLAIGLVAGGSAAMNQVIERDSDAKMKRTAMRPLVTGRTSLASAVAISCLMMLGGTTYLALSGCLLCAGLTLLTSALYLGAYTPLKKMSPVCTTIGAIPGAMPVLLGWIAVRGRIDLEALALFAIMFVWQFPHFHAIALLYRADYARANIRMLPVVRPDAESTVRSILLNSFLLVLVSFLPAIFVPNALTYLATAFLLGSIALSFSLMLWHDHLSLKSKDLNRSARNVVLASVLYLPALLTALMLAAV